MLIATVLGGVYYSQLGNYDRNIPGSYFADPRVAQPLQVFQANLAEIESIIGKRNLSRIPYLTLRPFVIPQSINI